MKIRFRCEIPVYKKLSFTDSGKYEFDEVINMKHPEKWRETEDPHSLPYKNFSLLEVIGYPHAGNDVFQVKGIYKQEKVEAYIKVARQLGADIENEINTINAINCELAPSIIDYDDEKNHFFVSIAKQGERLSTIVGDNSNQVSFDYLYEYGQTLSKLHAQEGVFPDVKERRFFHIPDKEYLSEFDIGFVYDYLVSNQPPTVNKCFCHGDFHYANILWQDKHISAILDFELSGCGNKEFDIAWALILRPGQKFMNTDKEISLFMEGYLSVGKCNWDYVKYYMVLIYAYFYRIGKEDATYQSYVKNVFLDYCTK